MFGFLVSILAAAPGPTLFVLEPSAGGRCVARTLDVASQASRVLFEAPECPALVLFSPERGRVIYTAKGQVWIRPLADEKASPTALGPLPPGELAGLAVMKTTRNLRAVTLVRLPDDAEVKKGKRTVFRFEGSELDTAGLPSWGLPAVALLHELDAKGRWKRVKAAATRTAAGDTPGASVLEVGEAAPDVIGLDRLLRRQWCAGDVLDCSLDTPALMKLFGATEDETVGTTPKGTPQLAFKVAFGDSQHAVPPVFLCEAQCTKGKPLAVAGSQLGVEVNAGYALVTEEYSGNAPVVFDASGKQVLSLPSARAAVWLPAAPAQEPAGAPR